MKKKMSAVLLFTLSAFLLTSCREFFGGFFEKLFGGEDSSVTTDDIPALISSTLWGHALTFGESNANSVHADGTSTYNYFANEYNLYLDAFKAEYNVYEAGFVNKNELSAYHKNAVTYVYSKVGSAIEWQTYAESDRTVFSDLYRDNYSTPLARSVSQFHSYLSSFKAMTADTKLAQVRTAYIESYPDATVSVTFNKTAGVFKLEESVTNDPHDDKLYIRKIYELEIKDGRPRMYQHSIKEHSSTRRDESDVKYWFTYKDQLPVYPGPFYASS
ncbi:MAG TPA: hypothetical protein VFD05_05090 [Bacilli bacterium]|nr:hypothetical protein [Bacilli bacterium]